MFKPQTVALTILLAALTGIGPLTTDMYLPSLPDIARSLHATTAQTQLTISTYLIGFAIGQIFHGPFSDRFGRKPVLLVSLVIYTAGTLVAALAPTIEVLIAVRAVQGLAGSAGIVLSRAIVRDLYSGPRMGREMSVIGAIMALAPVVAPGLGGVLEVAGGWRATFLTLTGAGLVLMSLVATQLPETLAVRAAEPVTPRAILRSFVAISGNGAYRAYVGMSTLSFAGLFAWISGTSFVLQGIYGLSPIEFGFAFAVGSLGFMAGTLVAARIVGRLGLDATIGIGACTLSAGGLLMIASLVFGLHSAAALVLTMAIYLGGLGLVLPQSAAGAMLPFPGRAGAASSLMGVVQQSVAAMSGAAVGLALGATAWPLAIIVAAMGCLTLVVWIATRNIRRAPV